MEVEKRDYYFDNLKTVLIFLVVIGHFLKPVKDDSYSMQAAYVIISIFNMPLFIFVSGYFSKSAYKDNILNVNKIFYFLFLYVIFQGAIYCIRFIYSRDIFVPDIVEVSGTPWYLLAMAFWYLLIPAMKQIKPRYGLAISLVLSLLIGYQKSVGTEFSASRIITWLPFFALGYYMNEVQLKKILNFRLKYIVVAAAGILGTYIYFFYEEYDHIYDLLFSKKSYYSLGKYFLLGAYYRLQVFLVVVVFSIAIMYIVPKKKNIFSYIGRETLQIYMLHRLLRDVMECLGVFEKADFTSVIGKINFLVMTVAITFVLSTKPFSYIFEKISSVSFKRILIQNGR